ncbi:transcription initiation factor IIA subunit 2 [Aphis craccivora]|uniref:Transcription initiation factor IIA subunit 2 n=1 Tax=Aphis craccivora TaxID=307492 RepID=A0A6G0YWG9_APHCR|nr:transcription initiation factor IIA subunit 2 [Aphis craccivora]
MSYQLYRNTTLGNTLQESIDEMIQYGQITPALGMKILLQFDKSVNNSLATRVKSKITFKAPQIITSRNNAPISNYGGGFRCKSEYPWCIIEAGKMDTYRFCDNVWTFMLSDVEFKETQEIAKVEKLKIVACDGKSVTDENSKKN